MGRRKIAMGRTGKGKARALARARKTLAESDIAAPPSNNLTMRQAARNVGRRVDLWSGSQLRHRTMNFVSAGRMGLDETETLPLEPNGSDLEPIEAKLDIEQNAAGDEASTVLNLPTDASKECLSEFHIPNTNPKSCMPATVDLSEDTSEDEIIFRGRAKTRELVQRPQHHSSQTGLRSTITPYFSGDEADQAGFDDEDGSRKAADGTYVSREPYNNIATDQHSSVERSTDMNLSVDADYVGMNPTHAKRRGRRSRVERKDDLLDDYIANMDDDYKDMLKLCRLKDDSDTPEAGSEPSSQRSSDLSVMHGLDALFEAKDLTSTSREREGAECDTELGQATAEHFVTDSEAENIHLDALQRRMAVQSSKYSRRRSISDMWSFGSDLAAVDTMELDALYEYGMRDLNKASLKRLRRKQVRMAFELNLSDSELEFQLEQAWAKDRTKKKIKKQRREELRAQGMLGRNSRKSDLKAKYKDVMTMDDFRIEVKRFLLSSDNALALPPMKKPQRKLIHELAAALLLKSQSRSHGPSRFPVLSKTGRTPVYSARTISEVDRMFCSGKFNRVAKMWRQGTASGSSNDRRSRKDKSASYIDGDVVGASAPEIGIENKGRAMLEKMGWSAGTALGATNNKGILLPVIHVVKNSRTGLG